MKTKMAWWSSGNGRIEIRIPVTAIDHCSHSGPCDADVESWQPEVDWSGVTRQDMIKELREYGAWALDELNAKTDVQLREVILWIACGDIRDQETLDTSEPVKP